MSARQAGRLTSPPNTATELSRLMTGAKLTAELVTSHIEAQTRVGNLLARHTRNKQKLVQRYSCKGQCLLWRKIARPNMCLWLTGSAQG